MPYRKTKTSLFFLILILIIVLISGSALVYQHHSALKTRGQELKALAEQFQRQYNLQQEHLVSISDLVNNSEVHGFFTDLLRNYAEKFSRNKSLDLSHLPLEFAGFHAGSNPNKAHRRMGMCWKEQKSAKISLNRLYLLNKFGHDRYFTSNPYNSNDFTYSFINFAEMLHTCSHELIHYIQYIKHGRSSCESDLMLKTGKYDEKLAKEHEKWTKEISEMISNSGHSELEKKWKSI